MRNHERKRRTRGHVIADLSVNHVERQVLLPGYVIERTAHDSGIDLEIVTFDREGQIDEGKILLQVKATERLKLGRDKKFPYRIERADLVFWLAQQLPVILIIYDAAEETAYWLYVQSYFRKLKDFNLFTAGKTITVKVPPTNVLNVNSVLKFARFRERVLGQLSGVIHDEDENDPVR